MEIEALTQKSNAFINFEEFQPRVSQIQKMLNELVDDFQLKEDMIETIWYKDTFHISVHLDRLRRI